MTSYTPPKLISRGPSAVEPKGKGTVVVQVLINPDGSVKVTRVLKSTNPGDNAAALDIAQHSKYAPATRNGKPTRDFFDFTINFAGDVVSGAAGQIDALLHQSRWSEAKTAATSALAQDPNDALVQAQLGVADAFTHDVSGAVAAFDRAGTIPDQYAEVAMQAYLMNAQVLAQSEPKSALAQAQKAKALADRISPPASAATKARIDQEVSALENPQGGGTAGNSYEQQGAALQQRGDYAGAIKMYQAVAAANPKVAAPEYTRCAMLYALMPVPDFLNAETMANKAMGADPNYALGYYVAGVVAAENAKRTSNGDQEQDANLYLRKAADLARQQGLTNLASDATAFEQDHDRNPNFQTWITKLEPSQQN
ncbi:MAG TPA: energy transducer TonB [Candidatus Baltobacteraceae bacterium]|nr:energy transducer TonB [Candidatus Baltobacteraceae bacterium]